MTPSTATNDIKKLFIIFKEGGRYARANRLNQKKAQEYLELIKKKDELFDMVTDSVERKVKLEEEWGVKMGEREKVYLADQRGERLMSCSPDVLQSEALTRPKYCAQW